MKTFERFHDGAGDELFEDGPKRSKAVRAGFRNEMEGGIAHGASSPCRSICRHEESTLGPIAAIGRKPTPHGAFEFFI
jgi:hypothetical protein